VVGSALGNEEVRMVVQREKGTATTTDGDMTVTLGFYCLPDTVDPRGPKGK